MAGLATSMIAPAQAQMSGNGMMPGNGMMRGAPKAPDPLIASTSRWDANHDGVLTCDEWKLYANRLFNQADKKGRGFLTAAEFATIRKLEPIFADADLSYFDNNHDGKISRSEFVEQPSPFFARFDRNHDCRVTSQEMQGTADKPQNGRPQGRGGRGGGMGGSMGGGMGGMGGGGGGF